MRALFSSYPHPNMPGQPGQPGHLPETRMDRAFRVSILHIQAGTQPGHAGTLQNQDVSGRAQGRARGLPGPAPSAGN